MRIPTETVKFDDKGYEGYYVKMPRSVTEGFVYELQAMRKGDTTDRDSVRESNLKLLEQVQEWNLDGNDDSPWPGQVMPLVKDTKDPETRGQIIACIPIEIIVALAKRIGGTDEEAVPERVRDF
jgi:hypothetical protein